MDPQGSVIIFLAISRLLLAYTSISQVEVKGQPLSDGGNFGGNIKISRV
jgi:hypothetical protein